MDLTAAATQGYPASFLERLKHPYLFFSREQVPALRERMAKPAFEASCAVLKRQAEQDLTFPTVAEPRPREGGGQPDRGPRGFHAVTMRTAFMFLLTRERKYLERCMREIRAVAETPWLSKSYEDRLKDPANAIHFGDLGLGERAQALGCAYDWLHEALDEPERAFIRELAVNNVFESYWLAAQKRGEWGVREYFNWNPVINGGVGVLALATLGELPEAREAWKLAAWLFPRFVNEIGRDGDWDEGLMYTSYAMRNGALLTLAARNVFGTDFGWTERFRDVGAFCATHKWKDADGRLRQFRMRDSNPGNSRLIPAALLGLFPGDRELLRLWDAVPASTEFHGPERASTPTNDYSFWSFDDLFCRPDAPFDTRPATLPRVKHFRDSGIFTWRGERLACCALGIDTGRNHGQLDMGSFELVFDGEHLLTDLNYGDKSSLQHNCLAVNGGEQILRLPGRMHGLQVGSEDAWAAITLELPPLYGPILPRYRRHFLVWRDRALAVVDEAEACEPAAFEARFTTYHEPKLVEYSADGEARALIAGPRRSLLLVSKPLGGSARAAIQPLESGRPIPGETYRQVVVSAAGMLQKLRWVHVLRPYDPEQQSPAEPGFVRFPDGDECAFELLRDDGGWDRVSASSGAEGVLRWQVKLVD
ncbi:MAG: heparinase II/III-family protein [Planctomycetota bacterium]|nr:heparinase II/III-family protein [Planctomycetota bacterium]